MFAKLAAVCCLFGIALTYTVRPNEPLAFPTRTFTHNVDSQTQVETLRCPRGFRFDHEQLKCTFHLSHECYEKYCPNNHMGPVAYPKNCSKYVNCGYWHAEIQECPKGLLFNSSVNSCDYLEEVDCCEYEAKDYEYLV